MLILTEALSDGLVLGYYVYGPPTSSSWEKNAPAGYVNFAGNISDGSLRFNLEQSPSGQSLMGPGQ
jgi:hypothetical protein